MECIVRPSVSGDEAQRTLELPHLSAADETLAVQTAPAKGAITVNLGGVYPQNKFMRGLSSAHSNNYMEKNRKYIVY